MTTYTSRRRPHRGVHDRCRDPEFAPTSDVPDVAVIWITEHLREHGVPDVRADFDRVKFAMNVLPIRSAGRGQVPRLAALVVGEVDVGRLLSSCLIELTQFVLLTTRSASLKDVAANTFGALVGALVAVLARPELTPSRVARCSTTSSKTTSEMLPRKCSGLDAASMACWSWTCGRPEVTLGDGSTTVHKYVFTMRPWEGREIEARLDAAGFTDIQIRPEVGWRTADKLLVTGRRTRQGRPDNVRSWPR